jgi:NAD(P) transhydrogenase
VLIATGSTPLHPPDIPSGDAHILDADSFIAALHPIDSLMVIGSGPIGCEYASICAAMGTRLTLIDVADYVLGMVDGEIAAQLTTVFAGMGVDVRLATTVSGVARRGEVGVFPPATSSGRLAPVSMEQGGMAASHAFGTEYRHAMVSAPAIGVYSSPRSAWPGSPRSRLAIAASTTRLAGRRSPATPTPPLAGATKGMIKLIFDRSDRRVLGIHILGETAAEMVHVGQAVMQHGGTIDYFIHNAFNVPTWAEAYKHAAFVGLGKVEPRVLPDAGGHISVAEREPPGTKMVDR